MKTSDKITQTELVPFAAEILVSDFERSLKFYKAIEFEILRLDKANNFAALKFHDTVLMIREKELAQKRGAGVILRFNVNAELRKYYERLQNKDTKFHKPYQKMDYGLERFYIVDPDGYRLKFSQLS